MTAIIVIAVACLIGWLFFSKKSKAKRSRRPPFKKLYVLDQPQPIKDFERKMIGGMVREKKEVFVTAFCNTTHVLKVTASIGSKHKCRPSDSVSLWVINARRIGANRIRQYHNHPDIFGRSFLSSADRKSHKVLQKHVTGGGIEFESLLVYKGWIGGHRIKRYD
ncbi:MAG: hypothetical protein ABSD38_26505 [Syntrophorhabdales bacterium]|jgi:hypothetical protein